MREIIVDTEIFGEENKKIVEENFEYVPFSYAKFSTSERIPFFSHTLVKRMDEKSESDYNLRICSEIFPFFKKILDNFCSKYKINYSNILRANINSTFSFDYPFGDPHVDSTLKHYVLIMYLNDLPVDSNCNTTVIFDKKFDRKNIIFPIDKTETKKIIYRVKKEIQPEFGKILLFDGNFYHTLRPPTIGCIRNICIFNLIIK